MVAASPSHASGPSNRPDPAGAAVESLRFGRDPVAVAGHGLRWPLAGLPLVASPPSVAECTARWSYSARWPRCWPSQTRRRLSVGGCRIPVSCPPSVPVVVSMWRAAVTGAAGEGVRRVSTISTGDVADPAMLLLVPDMSAIAVWVDGRPHWWLAEPGGGSADLDVDRGLVAEAGPCRLWRRMEQVHGQWNGWGRPARDRFGVPGTPLGFQLWLDDPTNEVATLC